MELEYQGLIEDLGLPYQIVLALPCFTCCSSSLPTSLSRSVMSVFLMNHLETKTLIIWKCWKDSKSVMDHSSKPYATVQLINNPLNCYITLCYITTNYLHLK